jgi:hypothetical protein
MEWNILILVIDPSPVGVGDSEALLKIIISRRSQWIRNSWVTNGYRRRLFITLPRSRHLFSSDSKSYGLDRVYECTEYLESRIRLACAMYDRLLLQRQSFMERRWNFRISLLDKVQSIIFSVDVKDILRHRTYYARFDHKDKIREIVCKRDRFKMPFFPRTIRERNSCR